jgi:hypothetical protein
MYRVLATLAVALGFAALSPAPAAIAGVYTFTFDSSDGALSMTGEFTVDASDDVVSMTGDISGLVDQTITDVFANPSAPGVATSPDGSFYYNNMFYSSGQTFDVDGVLFTTAENTTGYWNLWGTSPSSYTLYESVGPNNFAVQEVGRLSVGAIPEASTWAMLGLGFAGLGLVGVRRAPRLANAISG